MKMALSASHTIFSLPRIVDWTHWRAFRSGFGLMFGEIRKLEKPAPWQRSPSSFSFRRFIDAQRPNEK
jgi:hypothetical protein